jgi:hypothetical protein
MDRGKRRAAPQPWSLTRLQKSLDHRVDLIRHLELVKVGAAVRVSSGKRKLDSRKDRSSDLSVSSPCHEWIAASAERRPSPGVSPVSRNRSIIALT